MKTLFFALNRRKGNRSLDRGTGGINASACPPAHLSATTSTCDWSRCESSADQLVTGTGCRMLCDGLKIDDISSSQRLLATPAFSVCRIFNSLMYSGLFSINRFTSRTKKGKTKHDVLFGLCVVFFPEKIPGTIYIYTPSFTWPLPGRGGARA